ncbi:MAG: gamma-glutamyl-gamma-aminobutyrate hydrolase family protein [Tannerellaceae bacterium]|jgi:microsomal dipeptidase-like Zn-dependent dipeptidase/gamma-glutamyl-gamma-aminobutyrate hydrolase PuuD|nr:gamma-glutamyl-gamma-aminobutyrate hydrolase family protein [Tannerellaceae bacterium]
MRTFIIITLSLFSIIAGNTQSPSTTIPNLNKLKASIDSAETNLRAKRPPLIGISVTRTAEGNSSLGASYTNAILKAGGAPVLIPATTDGIVLQQIIEQLDGILMTGGEDINPLWYNETPIPQLGTVDPLRDIYDIKLLKLAGDRNIPTLGICRGMQMINVAFGGSLYQDIASQREQKTIKHVQQMPKEYPSHTITPIGGTQLSSIIGEGASGVNSFHHQAVKTLAPGFRPSAISSDSIIEAIEAWPNHPILAVQWHPEGQAGGGDTTMLKLFSFLVGKADTFRMAKEIHRRILSIDTHTDTPHQFRRQGFDLSARKNNRVNLPKMYEGKLDAVYLAAFISQGPRDDASLLRAVSRIDSLIDGIYAQVEKNADLCAIATTAADLSRIKQEGKKAIFIGIENGYGIGKDLGNIARFKARGVTYITLCHSYDNDICDTSTHSKKEWGGLSPFGEEAVREMNRQGILVDLSHAAESTFWDVMKLTTAPVICSHSSARALCNNDRNLTDDQLRAVAANGGVVQVCLLDEYINPDYKAAALLDAIDHIEHIAGVAGIDHVGIGSDFDGGGGFAGLEAHNDMLQITVKLLERGYAEENIAKIWGGNFLRVLNAASSKK